MDGKWASTVRRDGWASAFWWTLLGSEAVLSLPDETASPAAVAAFYAEHRTFIIVLQLVGMASAALLGLFSVAPARGLTAGCQPPV
jgi:hypothetical protein